MMSTKDFTNDLDWTAFCYAAGELSSEEVADFEQRLAEDQGAREALARAVELTQAVAAAETLTPVVTAGTERSLWGRRLAWMAIGAAASLLAAALITGGRLGPAGREWVDQAPAAPFSPETGELAAAWSQTRQELSVASDAGLWFPDHLDAMSETDALSEDREDSLVAATPSWLTTAVLSSAGLPVDGDATPFDDDRADN